MNQIVKICKNVLKNHYGLKFQGAILYGSMVRKTAEPSSDIDILVLLNEPFDYFRELRKITDLLYPIQLDSEQLISAEPVGVDEYEKGEIQLYRNAKSEGIAL